MHCANAPDANARTNIGNKSGDLEERRGGHLSLKFHLWAISQPDLLMSDTKETRNRECKSRACKEQPTSRLIDIRGVSRTYHGAEKQNARRKVSMHEEGVNNLLRHSSPPALFFPPPTPPRRRFLRAAIHPTTSSF